MNVTINKLVDVFRDIASRHLQVNDFGVGMIADISKSRNMNYPFLWLGFRAGTLVNERTTTFNITLLIADKLSDPKNSNLGEESDNGLEILSDTMTIIQDVLLEIRANSYYRNNNIVIDGIPLINPTFDDFDGRVNGWFVQTSITIPNRVKSCEIPITPIQH